jgi:hypothetical protein
MDVDIAMALDSRNRDTFANVCRLLKLQPVAPVPLEDLFDPGERRDWTEKKNMIAFVLRSNDTTGPAVDVLIDPAFDMDVAFARALSRDVQGVRVVLAAIDDLILLKEHTGRAQDQADVEHLRPIRQISL